MSGRISQRDSGLNIESLRIEAANFKPGYVEAVLDAAYFIEDDKVFINPPQWTRIRAKYSAPYHPKKRLNIPLAGDLLAKILEKIGLKKKPVVGVTGDNENSTRSTRDSGG